MNQQTVATTDLRRVMVSHQVPLVPQLHGMSCWAAAAAMLVGWRDRIPVEGPEVASGAGKWQAYTLGLRASDVNHLASVWRLVPIRETTHTVQSLATLLQEKGPLWMGEAVPGLHVVVLVGLSGDGTPEGTTVQVNDPWPVGRGERYTVPFQELIRNYQAATRLAGFHCQLLHAGGRGGNHFHSFFRKQTTIRVDHPVIHSPNKFSEEPPMHMPTPSVRPTHQLRPLSFAAGWAADTDSPDYRHLNQAGLSQSFEITHDVLQRLATQNRFDLSGQRLVLFGLRGCELLGAASAFARSFSVSETIPDHNTRRCVMGVWDRTAQTVCGFEGSTVPNRGSVRRQANSSRPSVSNLLPTGLYTYRVGQHRSTPGAFRQAGPVVIIRSMNDSTYTVNDRFYVHVPADNIHPTFRSGSGFSSAGCNTVKGTYSNGRHRGDWADFRARAGLTSSQTSAAAPFRYMLLTGRDARVASLDHVRLRFGSTGADVSALQAGLVREGFLELRSGAYHLPTSANSHITVSRRSLRGDARGHMKSNTTMAFVMYQQRHGRGKADGIVTPDVDQYLGFDMVTQQSVPVVARSQGAWTRGQDAIAAPPFLWSDPIGSIGRIIAWSAQQQRFLNVPVQNASAFPFNAICKIELPDGTPLGTGWFIGPDTVLTAGHVASATTGSLKLWQGLENNKSSIRAITVPRADITVHSRYQTNASARDADDFDLAVLKISGYRSISWFSIQEQRMSPLDGVVVCGYASGADVQRLDTDTVRELHAESFTYRAETRGGTSGSPVFYMSGRTAIGTAVHVSGRVATAPRTSARRNSACRLTDAKIAWIRTVAGSQGITVAQNLDEAPWSAGQDAIEPPPFLWNDIAGSITRRVAWSVQQSRFLNAPVQNASAFPFNAICKIERPDGTALGTGWFIGPQTVLTAGHVATVANGSKEPNLVLFPGLENNRSSIRTITVPAADMTVHGSYQVDRSRDDAHNFDLAVFKVRGYRSAGWFSIKEQVSSRSAGVAVCGYASGLNAQRIDTDMVREVYPEVLTYRAETRGGTSGSPVFYMDGHDAVGTAVHVSGRVGVSRQDNGQRNTGCRLTEAKIAWIRGAAGEGGITVAQGEPAPGTPAVMQAQAQRNVFPSAAVASTRQTFESNALLSQGSRRNCILIIRDAAPSLWGTVPATATRVRTALGALRGRNIKMTRFGSEIAALGLQSSVDEIRFANGNGNQRPGAMTRSAWDVIMARVGTDVGWHVFGMALFNGYHSVTLFVNRTATGTTLYWADQWAIGPGDDFYQSAGSVSGFRGYQKIGFERFINEKTREWWDTVNARPGSPRWKASTFLYKWRSQ